VANLFTEKLLKILFSAFLVVLIVGFSPFESSDSIRELSTEGSGNLTRQIVFLFFLTLAVIFSVLNRSYLHIFKQNKILLSLVVFSICSALWSVDSMVTLRRSILLAVVIYTFLAFIYALGTDVAFRLMYKTLLYLILMSVFLSLTYENARHLSSDVYDDSLVDAWRGLFGHKNEASSLACLFIIMSLATIGKYKKIIWQLGFLSAIILLLFAGSKTCFLVLPISLILGYLLAYKNLNAKISLMWLFLLPVIFVISDFVYGILFSNPELFTGRGAIWSVLIEAIQDSPLLGHGYGVLWNSGDITPLANFGVNTISWATFVSHGHNGYLDVLASLGFIGYMLLLIIFIQTTSLGAGMPHSLRYFYFAFIVFFMFHNFFESSFLLVDKFSWLFFLFLRLWGGGDVKRPNA
jgi:exopolysaccharide production protein ExoQ